MGYLTRLIDQELDAFMPHVAAPGSFLLAGSASPSLDAPIHSGAGRILSLRIRPMALCERDLAEPPVSMAALLGEGAEVAGASPMGVNDYLEEILASGFPGLRGLPPSVRTAQLRSYTTRIFERELPDERGVSIRRPAILDGVVGRLCLGRGHDGHLGDDQGRGHPG